jgi:hypothetical protein
VSTLDQQPRTTDRRNDAFHEPRAPGGEGRVNQPQKLAPKPPRGQVMTGAPGRDPVKR